MKKRVLIIGAGIAGLSAGVYAQRSGFDVSILEQHSIPGGMCTGWRRGGYFFDGAMHWLTGSSPEMPALNNLWREVGALDSTVPVRYDEPFKSLWWEGETICLYRDITKTGEHFKQVSPEDTAVIDRFVADVRALTKIQMPVTDVKGLKTAAPRKGGAGDMLKMLPLLPKMGQLGKLTAREYAGHFQHPGLRLLLGNIVSDAGQDYGAIGLLIPLATLAAGDGGYPEGGSPAMVRRMADTFTALGGKILYNTKAEKVVVRDGQATGVVVNSETMPADAVIVTQEVLTAARQLFDHFPGDKWLSELARDVKPAVCCFVSIGVRAALKQTPMFALPQPIRIGNFSYDVLTLNNYFDYPGYAPEGGTALSTMLFGDSYDFWKAARDEGRYEAEKDALAQQVTRAVCAQFPQCEGKIEVVDVATPLTYERYTGSFHGSWMTIMGKNDSVQLSTHCTLKEATGVYFAGHRVMLPGGLPVALLTGRTAAQMVCRQFGAVFA